jgi:non-lysosomal glucosylceramidase
MYHVNDLETPRSSEIDIKRSICMFAFMAACAASTFCRTQIPASAWRIPIGTAPSNPGAQRPGQYGGNIDDGYFQGAPVGGFGAAV